MEVILKVNGRVYFPKEIQIEEEKKKIIELLSLKEMSLKEISKELRISEQLAYYKLKKLIKEGFIIKSGKRYKAYNSYYVIVGKENFSIRNVEVKKFFKNFINVDTFDGYIVIGSIDPHGEFSARARDVHFSAYLTLLLGKYIDSYRQDFIKFDTEIISQNLLKENLIVIGGPITNSLAYRLNTILKVRFLQELNWQVFSEYSKKIYDEEYSAVIILTKNPWNRNKKVLWIAGRRNNATKIAIDFLSRIEEENDFYYIICGKDLDGDGKLDNIEVLEHNILL